MKLVALVLTYNEAKHLPRCLESIKAVTPHILVVDSFSTDDTVAFAEGYGARVVQHEWSYPAAQFNWALTQLDSDADWVLRLDADEYLTPELQSQIRQRLPELGKEIDGVYCDRRMAFQGRLIRHGGVFPIQIVRLFRYGRGECEDRWMDEHIKLDGKAVDFRGEIIDDNLNSLTWWTDKHNRYANREAVDLLNLKYGFMARDSVARFDPASEAALKRWLKERVYARLPGGLRAFVYFFYRYVLRLGFLDGQAGAAFHVLQGFWYRYLVDAKLVEVERYMARHQSTPEEAIRTVLEIELAPPSDGRARAH